MSDKYILRSAAIDAIKRNCGNLYTREAESLFRKVISLLKNAPAADVAEVVHEKWLLDRWPSWPHRECSRCKIMFPRTTEVADQYWQYCPNCGARMDGGEDRAVG